MVKYSELLRILKKEGWYKIRQSGSHIMMLHPDKKRETYSPVSCWERSKKGLIKIHIKKGRYKN